MNDRDSMRQVRALLEDGAPLGAIVATTGVPAPTIGRWARGETAAFGPPVVVRPWRPGNAPTYAYLLGLYLGDGHLVVDRRGRQCLRVFLDGAYPGIVAECIDAIERTSRGSASVMRVRDSNVRVVQCGWKRWAEAFPQHGPGRKHERPIVLADWQEAIVAAHPGPFVRGLIHSDGCRTVNRFTTRLPSGRVAEYAYPRYFFSNLSTDIRALFCTACERLGVRWTQSNPRNISIAHRRSVAILEALVGPKA